MPPRYRSAPTASGTPTTSGFDRLAAELGLVSAEISPANSRQNQVFKEQNARSTFLTLRLGLHLSTQIR